MEHQLRRQMSQSPQAESDPVRKGSKLRTRKYRNNMKQDPTRLAEIRKKDKIRKRKEKKLLQQITKHNESMLAEKRKKKCEHMRRYRAKKKAESNLKNLNRSNMPHKRQRRKMPMQQDTYQRRRMK